MSTSSSHPAGSTSTLIHTRSATLRDTQYVSERARTRLCLAWLARSLLTRARTPHDQIHWKKKIGEGSFGNVYLATDNATDATVVVKTMKHEKATERRLRIEIMNLELVRNGPNIIQLLDVLHDEKTKTDMLVFEYVDSPTPEKVYRHFDDLTARRYLFDLLRALDYTHAQGLMHLDMKPNNTLYNPDTGVLRLIDWGFAAFYFPGAKLARWPGTRTTKAPELFLHYRYYDYAVDMWSFGCIVGSIILKRYPMFPCERHTDKIEWNKNQLYTIVRYLGTEDYVAFCRKFGAKMPFLKIFPPKYFKYNNCRAKRLNWATLVTEANRHLAGPDALDLLDRILVYDPEVRLTAAEALQHPYFDPVRPLAQPSSLFANASTVVPDNPFDSTAETSCTKLTMHRHNTSYSSDDELLLAAKADRATASPAAGAASAPNLDWASPNSLVAGAHELDSTQLGSVDGRDHHSRAHADRARHSLDAPEAAEDSDHS